jgi:glycosyltransferase involved in cell wall biosynthesis
MTTQPDNIAIAHKDYDCRGGGEVFVRRLAEHFDATVVTGRRNLEHEPPEPAVDIEEIPLSKLDKWAIDRNGLARTLAYMLRWPAAAESLQQYDTVITSGNEPLWWCPEDDQTVIAYTHSTPRFMYDLFTETTDFSGLTGRIKTGLTHARRVLYETNVRRPDHWIANSDLVARRMRQYWNLDDDQIDVVYPPVDCHQYAPSDAPTEDFYLHLGRLAGHKRVDEVVDTFANRDDQLVIAGKGPEGETLRAQADAAGGDNIEFVGFVDEATKQRLMSRARAMVYPALNEDFGMVPIEAMAAGTPVIGVNDGFTRFQIHDGKNGIVYPRGGLGTAIERFESAGCAWSPYRIAKFARMNFAESRFYEEMAAVIERVEARTTIEPDLEDPPELDRSTAQPVIADGGADSDGD